MITKEEFTQIISELNREYSVNGGSENETIIIPVYGHNNYSLSHDGNRLIVCYDCLSSKYPYIEKDDMKKYLSEMIDKELRKAE